MKVYIQRIPDEGMELESQEPKEVLDLDDSQERFLEPIHVLVKVFRVSGNLLVQGRLTTHVILKCSMCSEEFTHLIDSKRFTYNCEILGKDIIDLTDPIREDIIVALPIRPMCRDLCRGLCKYCGKNLNEGDCACSKSGHEFRGRRLGDYLGKNEI